MEFNKLIENIKIDARPYQQRIVEKAINHYKEGFKSVLIESPTGSGKTVMAMLVLKYLQDTYGYTISWVAMRRNLLTQTRKENIEKQFNIKMNYVSMFDKDAPEVDILCCDEFQHDSTTSMSNIHSQSKAKIILALSATPYRSDKATLFFDKVIRDANIRCLIRDGFLSPFDHYTIKKWTPRAVAEIYLNDIEKWGKSIVFFHKRKDCEEFVNIMNEKNVAIEMVTATSDKDNQIERFVKGEVKLLVNMMILTEGFDCPDIKTVFCRPSSKGCTVQMAGRGLRLHSPTPLKNIVQSSDTKYPFLKEAKSNKSYLDDHGHWKTLEINPNINAILKKSIKTLTMNAAKYTKNQNVA